MSRDELDEQINVREVAKDVLSAIDDVSGVEFESGKRREIDIGFTDRTRQKASISFVHAVPQSVVLAGLEAMRKELESIMAKEAA
jgi:hypothetical protein